MLKDNKKRTHFVVVGKGGGGGIDQVQSDWNQTDTDAVDYIKNKPSVSNEWFGTQAEFDLIDPKDANTVYYIEDANGSVVHNNKTYGIKVKIENPELTDVQITSNGTYQHTGYYGYDEVEVNVQPNLTTLNATTNDTYTPTAPVQGYSEVTVNVQPNLTTLNATVNGTYTPTSPAQGYSEVTVNVGGYVAPQYLTGTYTVTAPSNLFRILRTTDDVSGWRYKGATNWERPATTISVTTYGLIEIEFNLTNNTTIPDRMFNGCGCLVKIELPSSVTTIGSTSFFNTGLIELPNLENVTSIGDDCFYNCFFNYVDYTINDNVNRSGWRLKSMNFSDSSNIYNKFYVNGTVFRAIKRWNQGDDIDFSNGIDGLPIYKWYVYGGAYSWNLNSIKFPATLTNITGRAFQSCTITDLYFYGTIPPVCDEYDEQNIWYSSNITNIYVPAEALTAYQNSSAFADVVSKIQAMS